jgi:ubiquinone/menaquinone biosynthesis C-methylase UbiE
MKSSAMASGAMGGAEYLQGWHDRHPGATSAMLDSLTDEVGRNSYEMLAEVIQDGDEPVLDLACGDGYLLELLHPARVCVGMDWNIGELDAACRRIGRGGPLARANAAELPVVAAGFGAVTCHYALMLLQPLEGVLAEVARVLRPGGLLATVLPAPPPENTPNPISVFRAVWQEVGGTYPVNIPPIQDDRVLQLESLERLLANAGFSSVLVQSFSASKRMAVDEASRLLLLTYLPDLLPPAGYAHLTRRLKVELDKLDGGTGTVTFVEHSDLVTTHRL